MRRMIAFLPMLLLVTALAAVSQDTAQPSLGDYARQHRANKAEQPAKVYTNETLPANDGSVTTGATGTTVPAPAAPVASAAAPAGGKQAPGAKPGKVDPEKVKQAQRKLDGLKNDMANLDKNYKLLEEKIANSTDDFQRDVYQRGLETRDSETAALQQRIAAAQKELEAAQKGEPEGAAPAPAAPAAQQPPAADNTQQQAPPSGTPQ